MNSDLKKYIDIAPEVAKALATGEAVVALESTIIAHGMPYPQNVETAREVENIIRAEGAVPATIAVLDGRICIGLDDAALERLGQARDVAKLSRRDLPMIVARKGDGATTVAATMICAAMAGIAVFATGGIGGVHRGAEDDFDISADLDELAKTPVSVICAGAKSILDLPKTLEYLETRGVPVVGYQTDQFPAFYCRESGLAAPLRADDPQTIAAMIRVQRELGYASGSVIANPIPAEFAMEAAEMDRVIASALSAAGQQGIKGKAVTPFLLSKIVEMTEGRSLEANIALVKNNAVLAARIAKGLSAGA
ncbi:pseudouridine-5'-phosphate glycosidase [Kiloniella laminariae]|uniref:Pseudouridine-5'-phosphate glycosidase n=1 Tax=Kiloniella laminariae TaxID=454162 RepID=A0ABT4LK57_9PROT|nr:pseudouridine-5'-phosphate glycosidase [Kiloniella laminariae]MCZ4281493.1 pseudouridine-5'-phosphate glycosidase [Kiloniella laminariae]